MKSLSLFLVALTCILGVDLLGQGRSLDKCDLLLRKHLTEASAQTPVHLIAQGNPTEVETLVNNRGGVVKDVWRDYSSCYLTTEAALQLLDENAVEKLIAEGGQGQPLLEKSLTHVNGHWVHDGKAPLPASFMGEDVVIGIIDAGLDLNHPDFIDQDSNTRVRYLWDQNMGFSASRTPSYGYGQVWMDFEIDSGLCPHDDQSIFFGHGTNTAGIAAANGRASSGLPGGVEFVGLAPKSDLIIVSSNFGAFNWTATIADAVDFIVTKAAEMGKPCVINASLGTYIGSHDGLDIAAQMIEEDITDAPGRAMVCAAGNAGNEYPFHLGYDLSADTNFTWFQSSGGGPLGGNSFLVDMWSDTGDFENAYFAIGADKHIGGFQNRGLSGFVHLDSILNTSVYDTLISHSGNTLATIHYFAQEINGRYRIQAGVTNFDSTDYYLRLSLTGSGRMDLWSAQWLSLANMVYNNLPSTNQFPEISFYKSPDLKQSLVSSWACSDKVITVANYTNRTQYVDVDEQIVTYSGLTEGALAESSSWGPARTGIQKPEVAAPGDITLTSGAAWQIANQMAIPSQRNRVAIGGMHNRAGGTSSASPVVTGIGALFFEKCPNADWEDFKNAIIASSFEDQFTGNTPSIQWGYGKADAFNALLHTNLNPPVAFDDFEFCSGDSLQLQIASTWDSLTWNTGSMSPTFIAKETGSYFAFVRDERGCIGYSDTVAVFERPLPTKPATVLNGALPACPLEGITIALDNDYGAYQWSDGSHLDELQVTEAGQYYCQVQNKFGCENYSDTVEVTFYPKMITPTLSLLAGDRLVMNYGSISSFSTAWKRDGIIVSTDTTTEFQVSSPGEYWVELTDSNGCTEASNPIFVLALGVEEDEAFLAVFPNPIVDVLNISTDFNDGYVIVRNSLGQTLHSLKLTERFYSIDTRSWASGTYFLTIEADGLHKTMRIVK